MCFAGRCCVVSRFSRGTRVCHRGNPNKKKDSCRFLCLIRIPSQAKSPPFRGGTFSSISKTPRKTSRISLSKIKGRLRIGRTAHCAPKRTTPRCAQLFPTWVKVARCAWRTFRAHWCCEKEVSKRLVFGKFQNDLKFKVF